MDYNPFANTSASALDDGIKLCDAEGNATGVDYDAGETVADVLLEVEGVQVTEIIGGKRKEIIQNADLMILSIMPTKEELELANTQLGLPPGTIASDAEATGKPFVFIIVGNYKLPLGVFIPTLQFDKYTFNFVVGVSFIEIVLPSSPAHADDVDAFPFIVGTYGSIRVHPNYTRESVNQTQRTLKRVANVCDAENNACSPASPPQKPSQLANNTAATNNHTTAAAYDGAIYTTSSSSSNALSPVLDHANTAPNNSSQQHRCVLADAVSDPHPSAGVSREEGAGAMSTYYPPQHCSGSYGHTIGGGSGNNNAQLQLCPNPTHSSAPISQKIAAGIQGVGRIAAHAIVQGSAIVAGGIGAGAGLFVRKTRPCQQPLKVNPKVKNRLEMTRKLTKGAAVVSGAMATSAISVAAVVGNVVGSNVSDLLIGDGQNAAENPRGRAALEVGSAVFTTGALVFSSLMTAKTQILTATGENITKIVTHKLGDEAGAVSGNAVGIALDAAAAATAASGGLKKKIAIAAAHTALSNQQKLTANLQQQQAQQQLQFHTEPQRQPYQQLQYGQY